MKHLITTSIMILLTTFTFLLETGAAKAQSFQPYKSGVIAYHGYQFPIVPGTNEWKQLGYAQRVGSLQVPADTLNQMSTTRLLETCLYYPFNNDVFAFDDQISSFNRVKKQFNGYTELYQRSDFVQQLINLYEDRSVAFIDQITLDYDKGLYSFDLSMLEFMLADAACFTDERQTAQVVSLLLEKMDRNNHNQVYVRSNQIVIGLAIGRCLQRTTTFQDYQGTTLDSFLQNGKLTEFADLEYVFSKAKSIINNTHKP